MQKMIDVPFKMMIRECSLNPNLSFEDYNNIGLINRENIHDTFKYKKFNNDFVSSLAIYASEKKFIHEIKPSYELFLNQLIKILNANVPVNIEDDENLTSILLDRLEMLKKISSVSQLKYEFPLLYKDWIDGKNYFRSIQTLKKNDKDKYYDGEHYYYSCALKKSLKRFIPTQAEMYRRYITDRHKLKEKYDNTNFNGYIKRHFDLNKIALFVIHEYLSACEMSNDRAEINNYLEKIELYLKNNRLDKTVKIYTDKGVEINYKLILKRVKEITMRLKSNDSTVNWILIPKDREFKTVKKSKEVLPRKTLMNYQELQNLQKIGTEKNSFYEKTNYKAKVVGLGKYKGYIGYIYENGNVILDREYDNKRPYTAKGNAIYVMSVCDFEQLSKCSKQILQDNPKVKRICHTKNWHDKVEKIIEKEPTDIDVHNTNLLIKRLKRKALY